MNLIKNLHFAFLGSSKLSVIVLDELEKNGLVPKCIITTPDKPQGRKLILTPNIVKTWAIDRKIKVYDPAKLSDFANDIVNEKCDLFIVASYGKIIPSSILNIPSKGVLNIHPSLLPKYRGPSPLPTAIIDDDKNTGTTIMKVDQEMDHGPIVAQKNITLTEWPIYEKFEEMMAKESVNLLVEILSDWIEGKIIPKEQDHSSATYTKKITKEDGLIRLDDDPYLNFRKIQAYHEWPQAYFMFKKNNTEIKVKVTQASYRDGVLQIERVIPEGSKEMTYEDFKRGYQK
jgi:methionyl-tRNA formyltransferase